MVEIKNNMQLNKLQLQAIETIKKNKISILNGYAGTGKSTVIDNLHKVLDMEKWEITKLAPTGKAALRIKGRTIHTWLLPQVIVDARTEQITGMKFTREDLDPSKKNHLIIIDESSMLDDKIFNYFMSVINNTYKTYKIVFVGDTGQLEPVGYGRPFFDMVERNTYPTITLTEIMRQDNDLIYAAQEVRLTNNLNKQYESIEYVELMQARTLAYENLQSWQIISPMNKFVEKHNVWIQNKIGSTREKIYVTLKFDEHKNHFVNKTNVLLNDKIVITRNLTGYMVNGTLAFVLGSLEMFYDIQCDLTSRKPECCFVFDEEKIRNVIGDVSYDKTCFGSPNKKDDESGYKQMVILLIDGVKYAVNINYLQKYSDLAYAITVHKAQGSEWENVILDFSGDQYKMKTNKLFYTALTRSKNKVYIVR